MSAHARVLSSGAPPALAVVAVTHNSSEVLDAWLSALEATGDRGLMELCLVDSGSSEIELALLERDFGGRVDVTRHEANIGFGQACNAGAESTTAPWLLFTNPDTCVLGIPPAVWDGSLDRSAIVGAVKSMPDGRRRPLGFRHLPSARWEAEDLAMARWARTYERTADEPAWVSGAALLVSRDAFEAVGGFSPAFFLYFEDADLCARHVRRGGALSVDDRLLVTHGGGKSSVGADDSGLESVNRHSARIFAARHGRRWQPAALYALMAFVYVPRRLVLGLARSAVDPRRMRTAIGLALDLLTPGRVMRRLGVTNANRRLH